MKVNKDTGHMEPRFLVTDDSGSEYGTDKFTPTEYLYVKVNGMIDVQIKMDEEGVAVDLYPIHEVDEPIATTWCLYSEAEGYDENDTGRFHVTNVYGYEYGSGKYMQYAPEQEFLYVKVKNLTVQIQYDKGESDDAIIISVFDGTTDEDVDALAETTAHLSDFVQ